MMTIVKCFRAFAAHFMTLYAASVRQNGEI